MLRTLEDILEQICLIFNVNMNVGSITVGLILLL